MNLYLLKRVLTTTNLILFFSLVSFAQDDNPPSGDPKYGDDSAARVQCESDLSIMTEYMKIDLHDYALPAWRRVFENCPASSKNIYISGAKIFSKKIEEADRPEDKMAYYDTLMMIYEKRMEYFGEEAYVRGRMGVDIIRYNDKDYEKAYEAFSKSAELAGNETDLNVVAGLLQTGAVMQKFDKIDAGTFLNDYFTARDILQAKVKMGEHRGKINRVNKMIDRIITNSDVKDCQKISDSFTAQFEKEGYEEDLLEVARELMASNGCDKTEFFAEVNEKLLEISPDASKAYEVARYNIRNENYEKAAEFLRKAIENEDDEEDKAVYQYQLAVILSSRLENYQEARDVALKAAENKQGYGEPYLLIANNYITGIKTCNPEAFDRAAIYWLAADYVIKAMQADPGIKDKASDLLSQYRQNYPSKEEAFFRSLSPGDSYSFDCWINESTTVKEK